MRIMSHRFLPVLIMFSLLFLVSSCQDEPLRPDPIDTNRPSIVSVKADMESPAPGDSVKLTVTTEGAVSSYAWTADGGSFTDDTGNPTYWIAPAEEGFYNVTCKVSNSSGSRSSTMSMQVKSEETGLGDAYWPFDLDFNDNVGSNHGQGDDFVTIATDTFKAGIGSALFSGQEESQNGQLHAGTALGMGADDEFSVFLWLKTTDDEGFIFGKSDEATNAYLQGASCIWIGDGNVNLDVAWVGGEGGSIPVNDGQWHSVVWTKTTTGDVVTYIDGVKDIETTIADWSDDEGFQVTMGAGWESADDGEWWPFTYQGYLDEVQFYQQYFTEEEVLTLLTKQQAQWPFDNNFDDIVGSNHGQGDGTISISNDVFIEGSGSALFEGLDEVENGQLHAGSELAMGGEDDFTVTLWIKTTDDEGFLFGKSEEASGAYIQGASSIWIGEGNVNIDVSWVGGAGGEIPVNDDNWHHVAWTKTASGDVATYIDGVQDINANIGDWGDDEGFQITMGAGWEEAGAEWWPGNYQGYMDDVRFFQAALSASMIQAIYQENAP